MTHPPPQSSRGRQRGFTLIEALLVVVVIATLVPPATTMMRDASLARSDSTHITRATLLAQGVMEQVLADAASPSGSLGMAAFASSSTYLDSPVTGLRARLSGLTSVYTASGHAWTLSIGSLVSASGALTDDSTRDVYRRISVSVTWNSGRSGARSFTLTALVTDLTP